jgi:hypothetical protein
VHGFALQGTRFSSEVELDWSHSPTASDSASYEIWAFGDGHLDLFRNPVATVTGTNAAIDLAGINDAIVFEVRPKSASPQACATPDAALTVLLAPTLVTTAAADGVRLEWIGDARYGTAAVVGRGADTDHLFSIAAPDASPYVDGIVDGETSYVYAVELHATNLDAISDATTVTTYPAKPLLSAVDRVDGVSISWTEPPFNLQCTITPTSPAAVQVTAISPPMVMPCPDGSECTYDVACSDGSGHTGLAASITGHLAPPPPPTCTATSMPGAVRIDWLPAAGAAKFEIDRLAGDGTATALSTVAATTFLDTASPLFAFAHYSVFSVAADGIRDPVASCLTGVAARTTAPDAMNLAPAETASSPADPTPGQTFTTSSGGQLVGIELSTQIPSDLCLTVYSNGEPRTADQAPCVSSSFVSPTAPFGAESIQGRYFDLSSRDIAVSAGETLAFEVTGLNVNLEFSADAIPGVATNFGGSQDAQHDMRFKAFVVASAALSAPQVSARPGNGQALLSWTASPGAVGYDVLDATGATLFHTADLHAAVPVPPGGATFTVRALSSNGDSALSAAVTTTSFHRIPDARNLCGDAAGAEVALLVFPGLGLTQTFTVEDTGILAGLEVVATAAAAAANIPAHIEDSAGQVLASFVIPPGDALRPLSPILPASNAIDLSASGLHVTAGDTLKLVLGPTTPDAGGIIFRDSADTYPGGAAGFPDGTPGKDLCFQVYVTAAP